jgi:serine/threonine protein kinase
MAPELFQKQGVYSYASDLWSLGCILYEMATGKPPFSSSSLKELVSQIMDAPTPRVEGCSPEFNDLVLGLLEKDPVRRITWDVVRAHAFWEEALAELYLPPQPQFDNYLVSRGIDPARYYEKVAAKRTVNVTSPSGQACTESDRKSEESGPTAATTGSKSEKRRDLDLLRLSQTVKKNILKEVEEYTQKEAEKGTPDQNDIRLVSKDQELNFSEKPDEEEEKAGPEKTPVDGEDPESATVSTS